MTDPYFDRENCIKRLSAEYAKHGQLIVALDFDDTIFDFHKKGSTHEAVIGLINECQDLGFHIVIFTASPKERYDFIREHCATVGIKPKAINENALPELKYGQNGKIYFNILLDDRAGLWEAYMTLRAVVNAIRRGDLKPEKAA